MMQMSGIPDLYIAHNIWKGWLELKTGNNPATTLQQHTLKKLYDCGVNAYILVGDKPRMTIKLHDGTIAGYAPFLTNNIDGIEVLNTLKDIPLKLKE